MTLIQKKREMGAAWTRMQSIRKEVSPRSASHPPPCPPNKLLLQRITETEESQADMTISRASSSRTGDEIWKCRKSARFPVKREQEKSYISGPLPLLSMDSQSALLVVRSIQLYTRVSDRFA